MIKRGVLVAIIVILCAIPVLAAVKSITIAACPAMCGVNETCANRCTRLVKWCAVETKGMLYGQGPPICYDTLDFSTCARGITTGVNCKRALLDIAGPEGPLLKCNLPSYCKESVFVCKYSSYAVPGCPLPAAWSTVGAKTVPAWFCPKPDYLQNTQIFPRCIQIYDSAGTYGYKRQYVQVCPRGLSSKAFMAGACIVEDHLVSVQGPDVAANRQECEQKAGMWFPNAPAGYRCCGDNTASGADFMMLVNQGQIKAGLCVKTPKRWQWITRGDAGKIFRIELDGVLKGSEAVWTDNGPRVCGPTVKGSVGDPLPLGVETFTGEFFKDDPFLPPKTVYNDFTCTRTGASAYAAVECKGKHDAWSEQNMNPIRVHELGSNVTSLFDTTPYWCGGDGRWKLNLDNDQEACMMAGQLKINPLTKIMPIVWTGSRCCGEQPEEFYSDPLFAPVRDAKGNYMPPYAVSGCWNSNAVRGTGKVRRFLDEVAPKDLALKANGGEAGNYSIINFNGTFHGCKLPPSLGLPQTPNASDIVCANCTIPYQTPVVSNQTNETYVPTWHPLGSATQLFTDRNGLVTLRYSTPKLMYCTNGGISRIDVRADCQASQPCTDLEKGWLCVGAASGCSYRSYQKCGKITLYKVYCKSITQTMTCY
jgi:hypothetical protein